MIGNLAFFAEVADDAGVENAGQGTEWLAFALYGEFTGKQEAGFRVGVEREEGCATFASIRFQRCIALRHLVLRNVLRYAMHSKNYFDLFFVANVLRCSKVTYRTCRYRRKRRAPASQS